jgi:hypothetical protein
LNHQRKERYILIGNLVLLIAFLIMKIVGGRRKL